MAMTPIMPMTPKCERLKASLNVPVAILAS